MNLEHETDGVACWCLPDVWQVCPECEDADTPPADCWRCGGTGLVEPYDDERPNVIVHRDR